MQFNFILNFDASIVIRLIYDTNIFFHIFI